MGHAIFSQCGLSNEIDYSFLSLKQIPKLLARVSKQKTEHLYFQRSGGTKFNHDADPYRKGGGTQLAKYFRLPPLTARECQRVIYAYQIANRQKEEPQAAATAGRLYHIRRSEDDVKDHSMFTNKENEPMTAGLATNGLSPIETGQLPSRPFRSTAKTGDKNLGCPAEHTRPGGAGGLPFTLKSHGYHHRKRYLNSLRNHVRGGGGVSSPTKSGALTDYRPTGVSLLSCFSRKIGESPTSAKNNGLNFSPKSSILKENFKKAATNLSSTPTAADHETPSKKQNRGNAPVATGDIFILLMSGETISFMQTPSIVPNLSDGVTDVLSSSCIMGILKDFEAKSRARKKNFEPAAFALALTEIARER